MANSALQVPQLEDPRPATLQSDEVVLREELISAAIHDLRSPMAAINIFCEILNSGETQLDANGRANVGHIQEAVQNLSRILEDASEVLVRSRLLYPRVSRNQHQLPRLIRTSHLPLLRKSSLKKVWMLVLFRAQAAMDESLRETLFRPRPLSQLLRNLVTLN